jgi:monoamine oxidase
MRISHHHETTLAYCRELQVPVEAFVADSESAYLYQTRSSTLAGRRVRLREARADLHCSSLVLADVGQRFPDKTAGLT